MPELPEVATVVAALNRFLPGKIVTGVRFLGKMRLPFDAKLATRLLKGKRFAAVRRRAKYIVMECDGATGLLAHLGMTGFFHIDSRSEPLRKHDRLAIRLDNGEELRYCDARRFGFVVPVALERPGCDPAELSGLGLEPLNREFAAAIMLRRAVDRTIPVKAFIMDQKVVVGVGNIYASEALHAAGIDPRRPAASLDEMEWKGVVREVKKVLRRAIRKGGTTIRTYQSVNGAEGGFQLSLKVYGKAGECCPRCGNPISTIRQCGRSTFFCCACQR